MKSVRLLSLVAAAAAAVGSGCTDPVRDDAIDALGPETEGGPGPEHRPGQPCVLCHSDGGPASSKPFAIAGTVYLTNKPGVAGAPDIIVQFKDARGGEPLQPPSTGPSGNFFIPLSDWANVAFPIRVGLYKRVGDKPFQVMNSLINREPSCNYCHRPNIDPADLPNDPNEKQVVLNKTASSAGQLYVGTAK